MPEQPLGVVTTVAQVEAIALSWRLSRTDHHVTAVHGQWSGPALTLSATEDAPGCVRVTVEGRRPDGRRAFLARLEPGASVQDINAHIGVALAGHRLAERVA